MAASLVSRVARGVAPRIPGEQVLKSKLSTVTLDVTGTIIQFKGELGDIYCLAARRCGEECPDYTKVYNGFKRSYQEMCEKYPCFGHNTMPTKEWWRRCVFMSFEYGGYHYPPTTFEQIFQRIYSAFGSTRAYQAFDDSLPFMNWIKERNIKLGIVSNETERYGDGILPMFGFDEAIDFTVFSKNVGVEKPDPKIFQVAARCAGEENPSRILHIGDSLKKDYYGARSVGFRALLIDRFHSPDAEKWRQDGIAVCRDFEEAKLWIQDQHLL
mmetsp:Transcript_43947/g.171689  ORF Transcript_43947/g.171689 Transcript_43947/m.171689 type:complete len:270 (-) Transcript_43947:207-1016(-)